MFNMFSVTTANERLLVGSVGKVGLAAKFVASVVCLATMLTVSSCRLSNTSTDLTDSGETVAGPRMVRDVLTFNGANFLQSAPHLLDVGVSWTAIVTSSQNVQPYVKMEGEALVSFVIAPWHRLSYDDWVGFGGSFTASIPVEKGTALDKWAIAKVVEARLIELLLQPVDAEGPEWLPWRDRVRVMFAPDSPKMNEGREYDIGTLDSEFRKDGWWTRVRCSPNSPLAVVLVNGEMPSIVASGKYQKGNRVGIWNYYSPTTGEIVKTVDYSVESGLKEVETVPRKMRLPWRPHLSR